MFDKDQYQDFDDTINDDWFRAAVNEFGGNPYEHLVELALQAGEVVRADQGGVCASMNAIIAQLPKTLRTAYVISSSGCPDKGDDIHFSSEGYRELGTAGETLLTFTYDDETP